MSNFTTNNKIDNPISKIKSIALGKADKVASKIPGYKKVKNISNKIKDAGFSVDVGKDKVGIKFEKKF